MMSEKFTPEEYKNFRAPKETSKRLLNSIESMLKIQVKEIKVNGREHLKEIPEGKKVIVVTTHVTDLDIPVTIKTLGKDFDFVVTHESVQDDIKKDPKAYLVNQIAGQDNFLPVEYKKIDGKKVAGFNPDDYENIKDVLGAGEKTVIFSAHNPSHQNKLEKGGYGAVYLAQLTPDSILLPVSVNITKAGMVRSNAEVTISEPIIPSSIEGVEHFSEIFEKRSNGQKLTKDDIEEFSRIKNELQDQTNEIMHVLAANISPEKRGKYGEIQSE